MKAGYIKRNRSHLQKIDSLMLASFFTENKDFYAAEFRNAKLSLQDN